MHSTIRYIIFTGFTILMLYLIWPQPAFPLPPQNSPQSQEPGDLLEPDTRRAYFTNLSREELLTHYRTQFRQPSLLHNIPAIRIPDYPPEESEWHVYMPLKSSYLEQLVFPLKTSIFISAYQPTSSQDQIAFEGQPYQTKFTIKYYPSHLFARLLMGILSLTTLYGIIYLYRQELIRLWKWN